MACPSSALVPRCSRCASPSSTFAHPLASLGRLLAGLRADPARTSILLVAVFGMLAFRTALGRSDLKHLLDPVPAAAVLLVVAVDRLLAMARGEPLLAAWRAVALLALAFHTGFAAVPTPLADLHRTYTINASLWREGRAPVGDPQVMRVARFVQLETEVDRARALPAQQRRLLLPRQPSQPDPLREGSPDRDPGPSRRGAGRSALRAAALSRLGTTGPCVSTG